MKFAIDVSSVAEKYLTAPIRLFFAQRTIKSLRKEVEALKYAIDAHQSRYVEIRDRYNEKNDRLEVLSAIGVTALDSAKWHVDFRKLLGYLDEDDIKDVYADLAATEQANISRKYRKALPAEPKKKSKRVKT